MNLLSHKNSIIVTALGTLAVIGGAYGLWRTRVADTHADSIPMQTIVFDTLADLSAEQLVHSSDMVVIGTITDVKGFKAASHIRKGKEDIWVCA
jgi:hypothetical protein